MDDIGPPSPLSNANTEPPVDCPDKGLDFDLVPISAELRRLIPQDAVLLGYYEADLNLDGKSDDLLVIERNCSDRSLLIVTRQRDGSLSVVASNDHLIWSGDSGNSYDITASPGQFEVSQHDDGQATRMLEDVTFVWSKKRRTWVVKKATTTTWYIDANTSNEEAQKSAIGMTFEEYGSESTR